MRIAVAVAAFAALAIAGSIVRADDTYTIKRTFKAGETDRYKTTLDIEAAGGMKLQIAFATTEKTLELKDDGSMVRSITVESADLLLNGQAMPMPGFKPATIKSSFDKDGKPIKEEGEAGQFRQMISMTRPIAEADRPLKIGEEWKTEVPTVKDGTKKLNVTVTLVGLEPRSETVSADAFKIKTVADGVVPGPEGDQKVRIESVSLVARDTGTALRVEGTVTGVSIPQFGDAKIGFKVVRQPDKPTTPTAK
jgi:hypothetical protein